jgi:hypothetical protein
MNIKQSELLKLEHLDVSALKTRDVPLLPVWRDGDWHMWFLTGDACLQKMQIHDIASGEYLSNGDAARSDDLGFELLNLFNQYFSYASLRSFSSALADDFGNLAVHAAKIDHFFYNRNLIDPVLLSSFISTEIEGMLVNIRSTFDLTQEIMSRFWNDHVQLIDLHSNALKKQNKLPGTFRKVIESSGKLRSKPDIIAKYLLPADVANEYVRHSEFFMRLRANRDSIVHGTKGVNHIFVDERGFAVNPCDELFSKFIWKDFHYLNANLVSLRPWLADIILSAMQACTDLIGSFGKCIQLDDKIFPGYKVFLRHSANPALATLLTAASVDRGVAEPAVFWN